MLKHNILPGGGESLDCLNTIRLLAAFEVVYGHAVAHLHLTMPQWLSYIIGFFNGVPIFFTLSGFLIWGSIGRSNNFKDYSLKRFWRIYPELWLAVAIELAVLLYLYSGTINWVQFGGFIFGQTTIFQFWTPDCLRGYGCGCPNGSLWTISVLIQFYLVAFYAYKKLHGASIRKWVIAIAIFVVVSLLAELAKDKSVAFKLFRQTFVPYFWMFLLGGFVAENKGKFISIAKKYCLLFVAGTFFIMLTKLDIPTYHYGLIRTVFSFFACLGIGYSLPFLNIKTDISYAVYIYHMTVVNAMIELGYTGKASFLLVVVFITAVVSWLSTVTVGKYTKIRKSKIQNRI